MQAIFLGLAWIYLAVTRVLVEFGRRVDRFGRDQASAGGIGLGRRPIGKRLFSRSI
jgi:hypothetical protein